MPNPPLHWSLPARLGRAHQLSGACSFARSKALLRAVFEEKALSEKDLKKVE